MRFVVQHGVGDPAWSRGVMEPAALASWARATEEVGFDALGFTDHPAPSASWLNAGGEGSADPISALSFCAAVTSTIRLMTYVWVLPYHNPYAAAHQFATLDAISGGRLTLGVGTGYLKSEFFAVGADPSTRLESFDDAWAAMTEVWSGEPVTREGAGYSARGTQSRLTPTQTPHPPVWIHGNSTFGVERAARYGQGWLGIMTLDGVIANTIRTAPMPDRETLARRIDQLRTATQAAGRNPDDVEVVLSGMWPMLDARKGWDTDRWLQDVAEFEELGVTTFALLVCGDDAAASEDSIRQFGEQIIAPLR
ncbi:MAG: putative dehydrogenase [Frankiales bacterium]|nr:putative dehydrogenase [Frankiales bacterium]